MYRSGYWLGWASLGILSQAWPLDQREVVESADRAALAVLEQLKVEKRDDEAIAFQEEVDRARIRDCIVKVTWTGDADVDVFIEEPSGTICSFRNPRTTSGGVMLADVASQTDKITADGYSEIYECPQAFSGNYRLLLRRVWGKLTAGKVTVEVLTHYGTKNVGRFRHQIPLGDQDAMAVFDLKDGRRTEPLREQQVANAAAGQLELNQAIVAQQINTLASDSANVGSSTSLDSSRAGLIGGLPFIRGAVGYQPVITVLPTGANMTVTGVISADRRYVRISPSPFFSQIGQVTTFNIATGATGTSPTPPPGGGGVQPTPATPPPSATQ